MNGNLFKALIEIFQISESTRQAELEQIQEEVDYGRKSYDDDDEGLNEEVSNHSDKEGKKEKLKEDTKKDSEKDLRDDKKSKEMFEEGNEDLSEKGSESREKKIDTARTSRTHPQ